MDIELKLRPPLAPEMMVRAIHRQPKSVSATDPITFCSSRPASRPSSWRANCVRSTTPLTLFPVNNTHRYLPLCWENTMLQVTPPR